MPQRPEEGFRVILGEIGNLANRGILFEDDLSILIRIDFKRVALANSQCAPNLLRDHHTPQFVDSPHYARCSHKYCLLLLSFLFALPVWIQDIWNIPSGKMAKVDKMCFIYFIHKSLKGSKVLERS